MQRFLEMYQAISGELPDPNQGQVMERCAVSMALVSAPEHWCFALVYATLNDVL